MRSSTACADASVADKCLHACIYVWYSGRVPALPAVHQVLRLVLNWKVGSDLTAITGTFWEYTAGPPSGTDLVALTTHANTEAQTQFKHLHCAETSLLNVRALDLGSATGASGESTGYGAGTRAGTAAPANACVVSTYHIARRYRGGKSRNYWPFGNDTDNRIAQLWGSTLLGEVSLAVAQWRGGIAGFTSGGLQIAHQVNVSYFEKGTWVNDPVTGRPRYIPKRKEPPHVDPITSSSIGTRIGSQRRRLLGGT